MRSLKILKRGEFISLFLPFPFLNNDYFCCQTFRNGLVSFQVIDADLASAWSPDNLCEEKQEITPSEGSYAFLPPWLGWPLTTVNLCCRCQNASNFHALPWLR